MEARLHVAISSARCAHLCCALLLPCVVQGNRGGYRSTTSVLSNVLGLVIFATLLCALWATIPRRNIAIDVEERDGVSIDDPSRSRLKGMTYATPTSRGRASATEYGGSNPFTGEAVPPRRSFATEERAF